MNRPNAYPGLLAITTVARRWLSEPSPFPSNEQARRPR